MPVSQTSSASADLLGDLQSLVRTNTRLWKRLIVLEMAAVLIAAPLAYLWIVFSLDMLVHLPRWGRILTSAVFLAVLFALARWIWRRWRAVRLTEDEVALAIERQSPGSDNRLINSLQISRDSRLGGSEPGEALLRENHASLQRIQLSQAAKSKPAALRLTAAFGVVAIGVVFFVLRPDHFFNAAARLFQPFAEIAPLYRTTLTIEPGDLRALPGSTVTIRAIIQGEKPDFLTVKQRVGEQQMDTDRVTVKAGAEWVEYTFPNVQRTLTYMVSAGDFTTPTFTITVPRPPQVNLVRATLHPPAYTGLPSREVESHGGDLEALRGTRAELTFVLDQEADTATLSREGDTGEPVVLERKSGTEFRGEIVFDQAIGYRVEARRAGDEDAGTGALYALRVLPDQAPWLTMRGLEKQMEALPGAEFPLSLAAGDDYGIKETGVFARVGDADWRPVKTWPLDGETREWSLDHTLPVSELGAVEGDKVEVALRARDADPAKGAEWTTGESAILLIGGEGAQFSVLYEQILKSEADIANLIASQQEGVASVAAWIQKLDPGAGNFRLDDQKNLDALAAAMKEQAARQEALRQTAGAVARDLVPATGNLRFSIAMLADAEMIRATRVIESVPGADDPQKKRSALSEARFTQERTLRSLNEIYEQYVKFRQDWELANMTPFVKMLADRQAALGEESNTHKSKAPQAVVAKAAGQRQTKLHTLAGLAEVALAGVGERVTVVDELLGQAFTGAAGAMESSGAKAAMEQAAKLAAAGDWAGAAQDQAKAAAALAEIHASLKKAGAEAIARAMKEAEAKASELAAQKELGEIMPGSLKASESFRQNLENVKEVVEMRESAAKAKEQDDLGAGEALPAVTEDLASRLKTVESSLRPDLSTLRLGDSSGPTRKFNEGALPPNEMVAPLIPDKIEDLIGQLLDEADEMGEQFDTLTANSGLISADPGEVGKIAGRMNSSGATSTTGNKKPPTTNVGGMSATGRQGARSYGKVAGNESINRRGRDQVQEGQFAAPDQEGVMTEKKSEDMQPDQATGIGGKRVDSEKTKFSLSDKGEWDDKFADRMQKPQAVNTIVERQGKPLDPRVAAMLRDMEGDQEQMIERANALRKELKNLYLPTDHLDELIAQISQNLEKLRETPDEETFREQVELIDELRSEARVFNRAQSGFQPSLPRNQQVRGRILDEPAAPPVPGYEEAVKAYYRKLAAP
jgi:hypothetical protein